MTPLPDLSTRPRPPEASPADVALAVGAAAILVLSLYAAWGARSELGAVEAAMDRVRAEVASEEAQVRDLRAAAGSAWGAAVVPWANTLQSPPSRVLRDLDRALPGDVRLRAATLRYGSDVRVDLEVTARNPPAYDRFLEALAESPSFEDLVPGGEIREGEVRSTVGLRYAAGGAR